jgi:single-strand DNA-binding protein
MSNIKFSGNIGKEPELRYTPDCKAILSFSVSLYTGGTKESGYKQSVWVKVNAWEELATTWSEKIHKGDKITVTGQPVEPREYKNRDTGLMVKAGLEVTAKAITVGDEFRDAVGSSEEY